MKCKIIFFTLKFSTLTISDNLFTIWAVNSTLLWFWIYTSWYTALMLLKNKFGSTIFTYTPHTLFLHLLYKDDYFLSVQFPFYLPRSIKIFYNLTSNPASHWNGNSITNLSISITITSTKFKPIWKTL